MVLLLSSVALAAKSPTFTADALVAKNLEARGGAAALAAVKTLVLAGELLVGGGAMHLDCVVTRQRPGAIRQEITMQGLTQVYAWDGAAAWRIDPFQGRRAPERVPPDDAKGLVEQAAIDGALLEAKGKGWPIRYLGVDDVDGTAAHELEIDRPGGDKELVWLDPDAFLEIRVLSRRTEHGGLVESQTDYGDYEQVAGVYFPLLVEFGPKDAPPTDRAKLQVAHAEANVAVDAKRFSMPEAP